MIQKVINKLSLYIQKDNFLVLVGLVILKASTLIANIIAANLLDVSDYGFSSFIRSIMVVIMPFVGLGLNHALLFYGSKNTDVEYKYKLVRKVLKWGAFFTTILIVIFSLYVLVTSYSVYYKKQMILQAIALLSYFILQLTQYKYRILKDNKSYSISLFISGFFTIVIASLLIYFFGFTGYSISFIVIPLLTVFAVNKSSNKITSYDVTVIENNNTLIKYGILIGAGSVISMLLFSMDIIMIERLLNNPELIAIYKVGSLIPVNLIFIPQSFLLVDFVSIVENRSNTDFIKKYYFKYSKVFVPLAFLLILFFAFFGELIISILFQNKYSGAYEILLVLSIGMIFTFCIKMPIGNILNAVGYAKYNVVNTIISLFINISLNYYFISEMGILGAAVATVITILCSSLIAIFLLIKYVRRIDGKFYRDNRG